MQTSPVLQHFHHSGQQGMVAWELDVPLPAVPPTHVDENYRSLYAIDADGTPGNDLALRLHPNGLCVVTLAPSHAALAAACDAPSGSDEGQAEQQAAQPAAAAEEERQSTAAGSGAEQQQQQPHKQETGVRACGSGPAARLALAPKLLQAEFRKGRGPLLQADTVLGRQAPSTEPLEALQCSFNAALFQECAGPAACRPAAAASFLLVATRRRASPAPARCPPRRCCRPGCRLLALPAIRSMTRVFRP